MKIAAVGLMLAGGMAGTVLLQLDNRRLRQRIAEARGQKERSDRLRDANRQAQELLDRARTDGDDGKRAIHADVVRLREEVAGLEKRAEETSAKLRAQHQADVEALASNRDPQRGLVRLENFQAAGRSTPAATFQTFVWAAMKGEDGTLAGMIALPDTAQERAEAVVAALPEAVRTKYSTPEKLAALFFADALTGKTAAQIVGVTSPDAQHAIVTVHGLADQEQNVPMQLGAEGWQIVVSEGMVDKLASWARGGPPPAGK